MGRWIGSKGYKNPYDVREVGNGQFQLHKDGKPVGSKHSSRSAVYAEIQKELNRVSKELRDFIEANK